MECAVALTLFICRCTSKSLWKKHSYKDNFLNGESEEKLMGGEIIFSCDMQLCKTHFPFACESVSLFVTQICPKKNALFYKNIIRKDKLRRYSESLP